MARWLIKMGVRAKTAWRTIYEGSRSIWALSKTAAMHNATPVSFFSRVGLQSLEYLWNERRRSSTVVSTQLALKLK